MRFCVLIMVMLLLAGCNSSDVNFDAIKVFDPSFKVSLETDEKETIDLLNQYFNERVKDDQAAPNFKYLIEFTTSSGSERWRYSRDGYTKKYSEDEQTLYVLIEKDSFNQLAGIN